MKKSKEFNKKNIRYILNHIEIYSDDFNVDNVLSKLFALQCPKCEKLEEHYTQKLLEIADINGQVERHNNKLQKEIERLKKDNENYLDSIRLMP